MPEFVPVLVAAVLSMIILLLAFGGSMFISPTPKARGALYSSRTILLGEDLVVMHVEGQKNITNLKGEISQGLFGNNEQKIDFAVDNYRDASEGILKLKTWNSNYYGNLMININGEQVYIGTPEIGERTISFDGSILKADNTIEVASESSGWKIWAPTVYIFNADLSVNYIGKKTQSLRFDLTSTEISNVNRARLLVFGNRDFGTGDLTVRLNGREIYSGLTTVYTDFAIDALQEGNNTLDLSTEENTGYNITSAQLILFF